MSPEKEDIDESTDDGLMNLFIFGKANGFTAEPFDTSTQRQVISLNFLCVRFPTNKLLLGNEFFISKVMIGINFSDREWFEQRKKFV